MSSLKATKVNDKFYHFCFSETYEYFQRHSPGQVQTSRDLTELQVSLDFDTDLGEEIVKSFCLRGSLVGLPLSMSPRLNNFCRHLSVCCLVYLVQIHLYMPISCQLGLRGYMQKRPHGECPGCPLKILTSQRSCML